MSDTPTRRFEVADDPAQLLHAVLVKAGYAASDSYEQLVATANAFLAAPKAKVLATLNEGGILEVSISAADALLVDVQTIDVQDGEAGAKYTFDESWLPLLNPYFGNDLPEWVRINDVPPKNDDTPADAVEAVRVDPDSRGGKFTFVDARFGSTSLEVAVYGREAGLGKCRISTRPGHDHTRVGFDLRCSDLSAIRSLEISSPGAPVVYTFPDGWSEEDVSRSLPIESWMPVLNTLRLTRSLEDISDASFERHFLKDAHKRLEETYGVNVVSPEDNDTLLSSFRSGLEASDAVANFAEERRLTPLVPIEETIRSNQSRMRG